MSTASGESTISGSASSTSSTRAAAALARWVIIMTIPIIMNGTCSMTTYWLKIRNVPMLMLPSMTW